VNTERVGDTPGGGSSFRVEVARTLEELEALRPVWDELPWRREEAVYEFFVTRLRTRPDVIGPYAALLTSDGNPVGGLAGRIEWRRLQTALGYRVVYAPRVRLLQIVDSGVVALTTDALAELVGLVEGLLRSGEIDAVAFPPFALGSELESAFGTIGGFLGHQPLIAPWTRRRLIVPSDFEEFMTSRSHKTRKGVRRDARKLEEAYGHRLEVEILRTPGDLERLVHDSDRVAGSTYQRRLGVGFADTAEQRAVARVGLEHGWVRGYLLYLDGEPVAFWLCTVFGDTMVLKNGGFDETYASYRTGIYLLMRVIEDTCRDPDLRILDFGPGDAAYKQQFSNESHEERNLVLFAPTFRARRINGARTAILGPARLAREALDAARLTDRVRSGWRGRRSL
jgi:Acetyltransferase (GNAT) domain